MDKDLITLCLSGAIITLAADGVDRPIDFLVQGTDGTVLVADAGWWNQPQWGMGAGLGRFSGTLVRDVHGYDIQGNPPYAGHVTAAELETLQATQGARMLTDVARAEYLTDVARLQALYGTVYDLGDWIDAMNARPPVDPTAVSSAQATRRRPVGRIVVKDGEDRKVATMAADVDGRTAVAGSSLWLSSMAAAYAGQVDRPPLDEWITWLAGEDTHDMTRLTGAGVQDDEGTVQDVAERLLAAFP